ncbi:helicase, partial [Listeria monocytogenes]
MTTRNKNSVLFLVHRKELIDQIRNTLTMNDVDMNFVNLGMVQTVVRRLEKTSEPALIIIDESHHVLANS